MKKSTSEYIPDRQDIIWIDFQPSKKQELRGRHPAVVLSSNVYTKLTGLVAITPITHAANNRLKDFFIALNGNTKVTGYINPLQFYTFSCTGRQVEYANEILDDVLFAQVQRRIREIIG